MLRSHGLHNHIETASSKERSSLETASSMWILGCDPRGFSDFGHARDASMTSCLAFGPVRRRAGGATSPETRRPGLAEWALSAPSSGRRDRCLCWDSHCGHVWLLVADVWGSTADEPSAA